jgi:hypothetical protein
MFTTETPAFAEATARQAEGTEGCLFFFYREIRHKTLADKYQ